MIINVSELRRLLAPKYGEVYIEAVEVAGINNQEPDLRKQFEPKRINIQAGGVLNIIFREERVEEPADGYVLLDMVQPILKAREGNACKLLPGCHHVSPAEGERRSHFPWKR